MSNKMIKKENTQKMITALEAPKTFERIKTALGPEKAGLFTASMVDLIIDNPDLQDCEPGDIVKMAVKAASLGMPVSKELGFVWIIPRRVSVKIGNKWEKIKKPCFQIGYKGYIQLALNSGCVKAINAGTFFEGEKVTVDKITGDVTVEYEGKIDYDKPRAFFAYLELSNGFRKVAMVEKEKMDAHIKKHCQASGAWKESYIAMAEKTVLSHLVRRYAPLSITAMGLDTADLAPENESIGDEPEEPMRIEPAAEVAPPPKQARAKKSSKSKAKDEPPPPDDDMFDAMPPEPDF